MRFRKIKLKNGLTILHEKRDVPVTTVMLAAKFGAINENENEKGIAHFIEHLCFKGTDKRTAKQIAADLERVGGVLNAFTSEQETAYHVKLPSDYLELAMDVIFDIFFSPTFPEEEVKKESNVICEEIRMYYDNPRARVIEKIKENLYEKPFGMSIAGIEKNIKNMTRNQLIEKHREVYYPANSILAVVGNNNFEDVVKFAERFSVNRNGKKPKIPKLKLKNTGSKETRKGLQQASFAIGMHFPSMSDKEKYAAEVFATIFGKGMSSKLFTEVREKRGLAYAVKADMDNEKDYGYLLIYVGTDKSKIQEAMKICIHEFKSMSEISERELEDGKKQVIGHYEVATEDCAVTALNLILEEISGNAEEFYKFEKNINSVTLGDIKKLSKLAKYSYFILSP